ncbi:hypothetical protein BD309DRAFT_26740 [Dichomitus squalens]|nr:hypothetical protein BD309DRAFT_26740 [Dichomitus squalens]
MRRKLCRALRPRLIIAPLPTCGTLYALRLIYAWFISSSWGISCCVRQGIINLDGDKHSHSVGTFLREHALNGLGERGGAVIPFRERQEPT